MTGPLGHLGRYPIGGHDENISDRNAVYGLLLPGDRSGLRLPEVTGRVAEHH